MAVFNIPTTEENYNTCKDTIKSRLNQDIPPNDAAFVDTLSFALAGMTTGIYNVLVQGAKQSLAISATGDDLEDIGENFEVVKKLGTPYKFTTVIDSNGTATVPLGTYMIGEANGQTYTVVSSTANLIGLYTEVVIQAIKAGTGAIMSVGDNVSLTISVPGITKTFSVVTEVLVIGVEPEPQEIYRSGVLAAERSTGGGVNSYDIRKWCTEDVEEVLNAYPYSGKPGGVDPLYPGDRTVYIESSENDDGIATQAVLDDVTSVIETDPETGFSRRTLGSTTMEYTWVEPIKRLGIFVTVLGAVASSDAMLAKAKEDIESELDLYLRSMFPYIPGLDVGIDRNDTITSISLGRQINDILLSYGGYASSVSFGVSPGSTLDTYTAQDGQKFKLAGSVTWG